MRLGNTFPLVARATFASSHLDPSGMVPVLLPVVEFVVGGMGAVPLL
jgi:hypothetical protein